MSEKRRLKVWKIRLLMFLAVIGPGFITANVDNDPGGILTYSQAGAKFGYSLLWTLIPTTVALIVVQEMAARMGAVTGTRRVFKSRSIGILKIVAKREKSR